MGECEDFPTQPILGPGLPANVSTLFNAPDNFTAGPLCVLEPELSTPAHEGAMMPANWVRPRLRFNASGVDLFEIRIHSPMEKSDLVVYTKDTTWYMDRVIWSGTTGRNGLANNAAGVPLTVTIRGVSSSVPGKPIGMRGDFNIAPVFVTGSMVFWATDGSPSAQSNQLFGFAIGDEGMVPAFAQQPIAWTGQIGEDGAELRGYYDSPPGPKVTDGKVRCAGCHTAAPDGQSVVFTDDFPWAKGAALIGAGSSVGAIPSYLGVGAQAVMKMPWWGTQSMTKAHFSAGDRILITSYGTTFKSGMLRTKPWQALPTYDMLDPTKSDYIKWHSLAWIDLESTAAIDVGAVTDIPNYDMNATNPGSLGQRELQAQAAQGTAWGLIATGQSGVSEVLPSINHAGDTIAYVATDYSPDGHPDSLATTADIRTVSYNGRAGGTSKPLPGASDTDYLEYYPSYSPDDKLMAFVRAPTPSTTSPDGPYSNRFGEVLILPASGGTPVLLEANIPNACAGDTSTAILNSWPKWSPEAIVAHGNTYYFLVFTSVRAYGDEFSSSFELPANPASTYAGLHSSSQLYLGAVVVDNASGHITTYPAVYPWNQNRLRTLGGAVMAVQQSNLTPTWDAYNLPVFDIQPGGGLP